MITSRQYVMIAIICLGTILCAFFLVPFFVTTKTGLWTYDSNTGVIGDTIGGIAGPIIGIVGIAATFLAFYMQYSANKMQSKSIANMDHQTKISNLENHFFRMIDYHNQNVSQFNIPNIDRRKADISEARRAFVQFKIQIKRLLKIVQDINIENQLWLFEKDEWGHEWGPWKCAFL